jgi:hypothetical protein
LTAGADEDPLAEVARLLAGADRSPDDVAARALLDEALAALDRAWAASGGDESPRASAHRAEVLRRLGRLPEAAAACARALEARLDRPADLGPGLEDLCDRLGGHEETLRVFALASRRHPGRSWEWEAVANRARARLAAERDAPIPLAALPALRDEVSRRLASSSCTHDEARPVTAAVARDLGHDPGAVLDWLARLGACCCDCRVARVRGPREPG